MNTTDVRKWKNAANKVLIKRRTAPVMQHPLDIEAGKDAESVYCDCCDRRIHTAQGYYQRSPMRQMTSRQRQYIYNAERWCSTECAVSDTIQDWRSGNEHSPRPAIFEDVPAYGPNLIA